MPDHFQASKFVDQETTECAPKPQRFGNRHGPLLNLTGNEIERALDVLDGVAVPISARRPIVPPTVSQLRWDLAELRVLLQEMDSGFHSAAK